MGLDQRLPSNEEEFICSHLGVTSDKEKEDSNELACLLISEMYFQKEAKGLA